MTEAYWDRVRAARASAALHGKAWKGPTGELYTGPTRKGFWLQPSTAETLAELLGLAVIAAESMDLDG